MSFADLNFLPPTCFICKGILKPDMVFFNEPIPLFAKKRSFEEAEKRTCSSLLAQTPKYCPAADIPVVAKNTGSKIIEINIRETHFTHEITDIFLKGKADEILKEIGTQLYL
jgi:NAD-dependent deacetylase